MKHGHGYSSCKYTAAQPDIDSQSEVEDIPLHNQQKYNAQNKTKGNTTVPTSSTGEDYCELCGFTGKEEIIDIGLGMRLPPGDIEWVQCDNCLKWYHLLCLDMDLEDLPEEEWTCGECG